MERYPQFINCVNLTTKYLASTNLVFCDTGAMCLLISTLIILMLFIYKAYNTILRRLFLYLMIATVLRELFSYPLLIITFTMKNRMRFVLGLHTSITGVELLYLFFSVGIMVYLFYLVYHRTRGNTCTQYTQKFLKSRSSRVALEIFYLISTLLLSCAYASIP